MSKTTRKSGSGRMSTGLVALGSAAVFAVYATGFLKTKAAADKFNEPRAPRRAAAALGEATVMAAAASASSPGTPGPPVAAAASQAAAQGTPAPPAVTLALPTTPASRPSAAVAANLAPARTPTASAGGASPALAAPAAPAAASTASPAAPSVATAPVAGASVSAASSSAAPASEPAGASTAATAVPQPKYKDGTYTGWGSCRHGDIQAQVVVTAGRIVSASIAQCLTRYSCSWISPLPPQVTQRQSPEVDYVSGATQSAVAFYDALVDALSKAK